MRHLLFIAFAFSFAGASCETPSPLIRSCPGSAVQTAYFKVSGSCGDDGVVTVTIANAGSCSIGLLEPTAVGLPTTGSFNDMGSATGYSLAKGNWNLVDPSDSMNVGTSLSCQAGVATASGEIDFQCEITECSVTDESDDVECMTGGTCTAHFIPTTADAGAIVVPQDAGDSGS